MTTTAAIYAFDEKSRAQTSAKLDMEFMNMASVDSGDHD